MSIGYLRGQVLENRELAGDLRVLRVRVPGFGEAQPGQFVHVTCGAGLTLPRPFSIFAVDPASRTVELLYRVVGAGTRQMAGWSEGVEVPLLGPIGRAFSLPPEGAGVVLVAGGVGVAPLVFFARHLAARGVESVLFWGIESAVPWSLVADLRDAGIVSHLASLTARPGFFQGYVTELVAGYVGSLGLEERGRLVVYTCGPMPMMAALSRFGLGGEASLEARMACGFGACVGCVVRGVEQYRRVCVDGPVFPMAEIDWENK